MPTLHRIGSLKIQVFADDHIPEHFHIVGPDFEVVVLMSDLSILKGQRYQRHIADALLWAEQHIALLKEEWSRLND